ncbi:hypothetical protein E2C01_084085 [Portunus trituberculatus]|uniref:Uncharacterized protein n=1 Tax=Portunus trituberculatus TaxID=210409 RepID=A0A5B7IX74_PORTR|nr:hypothetical protein [Portunus trituberculatus]
MFSCRRPARSHCHTHTGRSPTCSDSGGGTCQDSGTRPRPRRRCRHAPVSDRAGKSSAPPRPTPDTRPHTHRCSPGMG